MRAPCTKCGERHFASDKACPVQSAIDAATAPLQTRISELKAALTDIRDMPEYDQDDHCRLREKAKTALTPSQQQEKE